MSTNGYEAERAAMLQDGEAVPEYNRARPVDTVWDLGYDDLTTIWFVQAYDGLINFIDYHQGDGQTIMDYLIELQRRQYLYGVDYLPQRAAQFDERRRKAPGFYAVAPAVGDLIGVGLKQKLELLRSPASLWSPRAMVDRGAPGCNRTLHLL